MPTPANQPSLKSRALRLLAAREHSRSELERKLQHFEAAAGSLATTLDELQAKGFISEQRVLESVLNRRATQFGAQRIRQELQDKGVTAPAIAQALVTLHGSEFERALKVHQKKFATPPADAKSAARQMRFLASRGFSADVIRRVVAATDY